ncbi:MAG: alanine--glyoxylate aminotransferase family protein, partial [Chloroflexota bacterium]|nr:alanine--glyoxylate aminotransferase family protein [Chloroflexota bacterium]
LGLFADRRFASDTVTALNVPEGVDGKALKARLRDKYGVVVGGGQAELSGRILRVGHLGYATQDDLSEAYDALALALEAERAVGV